MSRETSKVSIHSKAKSISSVEVVPIFPKALPELRVGPVYDESGFTYNERLALRQAWKLIKPFERRYGRDIYFTFLMENYAAFEYFRWNGKLDLHALHSHSLAFMRFISSVIEQNDPVIFQAMLNDNNNTHNRRNVSGNYMQLLIKALISYVLNKLEDVTSASLESGFQRLLEKFQAYYDPLGMKARSLAYGRNVSKNQFSIKEVEYE